MGGRSSEGEARPRSSWLGRVRGSFLQEMVLGLNCSRRTGRRPQVSLGDGAWSLGPQIVNRRQWDRQRPLGQALASR